VWAGLRGGSAPLPAAGGQVGQHGGEHAALGAAGCVARPEGDVPRRSWLRLSRRHGPCRELGLGRPQTCQRAVGAGRGSRAEVAAASRHVPQVPARRWGRDRQLPRWGPRPALARAAAHLCSSAFVPSLLLPLPGAGAEPGGRAGGASWKHTHGLPALPRKQ